ncbi:hypothetical protein [Nonomuraea diastatica]|uniref:Uncharacterized protein n=1 Tax=Nonomuraea diastatica TaxID=1848329 RepID=A0A4R4WAW2_9ACTN|nr:hypothetical protein [Nonomuraea diastatica]TDD10460.1 hypothetical protein E1294_46150 [Nonomuraea diastatica]
MELNSAPAPEHGQAHGEHHELAVPAPAELEPADTTELRPVFPAWLADRRTAAAKVKHATRRRSHILAAHLVRSPLYLWRLVPWALHGTWLWLGILLEYINAEEYRDVVKDAKAAGDSDKVKAERKERRTQRKVRLRLVGIALLVVAFMLRLATAAWGVIALYVTASALFVARGNRAAERQGHGRPAHRGPVAGPSSGRSSPGASQRCVPRRRPSQDSAALALGFEGIRRDGDGWACTIDMPRGGGKTAAGRR